MAVSVKKAILWRREYPGWVLPFQGADRLGPADRLERLRRRASRIDPANLFPTASRIASM